MGEKSANADADFGSEKKITVLPVTSDQYPAKAKRPHNSRLDTGKLSEAGFSQLPSWQDALHRFIHNELLK